MKKLSLILAIVTGMTLPLTANANPDPSENSDLTDALTPNANTDQTEVSGIADDALTADSEDSVIPAKTKPESNTRPESNNNNESKAAVSALTISNDAEWFIPEISRKWYKQTTKKANRTYLKDYFNHIGYEVPKDTYALIAPLAIRDGKLMMQYYSYRNTAFVYSMTPNGVERFWPASTVKLAAAVMALLKMNEHGTNGRAVIKMTDIEGDYEDTVDKLCREAIIPSNNTAYNRLMEIAGFDEINDHYLRSVFHFPKMVLQRRYARHNPNETLRDSPEIAFKDNKTTGVIPARRSSGTIRPECPRESNCTTLAELAEVMFRVVLHDELSKERRLSLKQGDISMLHDALKKAPSCIGDGVAAAMGPEAIVYNKGGKVFADDRLEIAVVSSPDKTERYLIALSMPYYNGVEKETNLLAQYLIQAMQNRAMTDE